MKKRLISFFKSSGTMILAAFLAIGVSFFVFFCWQSGILQVNNDSEALSKNRIERIHLNTATVSELTILEGIGLSRAKAIVRYRDTYGPFSSVEELLNVPGIGEATLSQIRSYITLS